MPFCKGHLIDLLVINVTHKFQDHVLYFFSWDNFYAMFVEDVLEWSHQLLYHKDQ